MNQLTKKMSPAVMVPLFVALIAAVSGFYLASHGARLADGTVVLPLDDSYIHLQYAWQTAHGHFLQYNTGDLPTTGATSLSYMLLVALAFAVGVSKSAITAVIVYSGIALFAVSAALITDLSRRLAARGSSEDSSVLPWGTGLVAGLMFATSGWMAWAFCSGMETGLLIMLVIATLWAVLERKSMLAALFAALAALTRPEALILGGVILAAETLVRDQSERPSRVRRLTWAFLPLVAAAGSLALNYVLTGSFGSSGLQAKSLFTLVPFDLQQVFQQVLNRVFEITLQLLGGSSQGGYWLVFPLTQIWAVIGAISLWHNQESAVRRFCLILAGWVVLGILATATLQTAVWHHYRYQMPLYPSIILLASLGLIRAIQWAGAKVSVLKPLVWIGTLGVVVAGHGLWSLQGMAGVYRADTATIQSMQMVVAGWLRDNAPATARVAAHDIGVIHFVGERDTFDVVGLTTPGMSISYRSGPGAIFEALERVRPDYYAIYPDTAPPYFNGDPTGLQGKELFRVSLEEYSGTTSATGTQIVSQPDWSISDRTAMPVQSNVVSALTGWSLIDSLDVADLSSEQAHDYHWFNNGTPPGFPSDARLMSYRLNPEITLADGGRLMTGGDSFTIQTHPGQPLMLVARFHQNTDSSLRVRLDGHDAGLWKLPAIPGQWVESTFLIPAEQVTSSHSAISLTVEEMFNAGPDSRYSPFYYWAYQGGTLTANQPAPTTPSRAAFADAVRLLGWDSSSRQPEPGESFTVTLHWQALQPPHANLRVFLHFVDPANPDTAAGIVAQADSAPRAGTYPFWAWLDGEILSEPMTLQLPTDIKPGEYLLLLGIYDEITGQRLPVVNEPDFGSNRLLLTRLSVIK